ncbi:CD3337/EF1877 family mobilome membrane protein [Risungbinella massiliensis]|uniref:CD3337/EF1877 family mobilome membrane protein n=1 Tax=Risungbinella massiliensis TaxID=1329796 RepID=UPI0005CBC087|nr:type IV secretion system protein [Risungbinella massiliensis]
MLKTKSWVTVLVILVCFFSLGSSAAAEDPPATPPSPNPAPTEEKAGFNLLTDILVVFPNDRIEKAKDNDYTPEFSKYTPSRYSLEMLVQERSTWDIGLDAFTDSAYVLLHGLMNLIWQALLVWDFMVILAVEQAFSLDIVNIMADQVEVVIQGIAGFNGSGIGNTGIWGNFLVLTIICAGAWIAYKGLYKKDTTSAWSAIISTVFIMMVAFTFFANSSGIMKYLNKTSSDISQELLGVGLSIGSVAGENSRTISSGPNTNIADVNQGNPVKKEIEPYRKDVTSMKTADKVYKILIYDPYVMLQYGKTQVDDKTVEQLLNQKVGSAEREKAVLIEKNGNSALNKEPNIMFTSQGLFQRLGMLLLLCIAHFVIGVVFLAISLAMIVYQFFFVIFAMFAPFAFLMALYPTWSGVAMNWVKGFIGYQLKKILLGLLLSLILTISDMLYSIASPDDVGYAWTIILQIALVVGVFWKRNELIGIVNSSAGKVSAMADFYNKDNRKMLIEYVDKASSKVRSSIPRGQ